MGKHLCNQNALKCSYFCLILVIKYLCYQQAQKGYISSILSLEYPQLTFTCLKSTIEALEKGMKYFQS